MMMTATLTPALRPTLALALALALPAIPAAQAEEAAPHTLAGAQGDILAHHVRLTGGGGETPLKQVVLGTARMCAEMGKPVAGLNEQTPIQKLTYDVYYTTQTITTYKNAETLKLSPDCQKSTENTLEIEVLSSAGLCQISPKRKLYRGSCNISLSSLPRGKSGETPQRLSDCQKTEGSFSGINRRSCVITPDKLKAANTFVPFSPGLDRAHPGIVMQVRSWRDADPSMVLSDMAANSATLAMRVSEQVILPLNGMNGPPLPR